MKIYLLIKQTFEEGYALEDEEIEAYLNPEEPQQIAAEYRAYRHQIEMLNDAYNCINVECHPEWNGKIGELEKENRARVYALQKQNPEFKKWDLMNVIEVDAK